MKHLLKIASQIATDTRSDHELLISFAKHRDSDTLAELFQRHAPAVRRVAADVYPAAADEVVQAVFLLLAERAGALTDRTSAAGWLFQVARRLAMKARTASARRSRHEALAPTSQLTDNPLDDLALREVRALVAEELARLTERLRVPLVLHYWEGVSHAEAATRLGCSVSTLKRLLDAGRERLGARLARRGLTGASVLTALVALHAQAVARSPRDAGLVNGLLADASTRGALRAAALLRGASGAGIPKTVAVTACVLLIGVGLAFGLAPRGDQLRPPDAVMAEEKQPLFAAMPAPVPEIARDGLPAGAVTRLGSNAFHHGDIVGRVFVTSDGRHAVSIGSEDHTPEARIKTKLWDLETGKELPLANGKLPGVPGGVKVVAVAPVGKSLALVVIPRDRIKAGEAGWWFINAVRGEVLAELPRTAIWGRSAIHPAGTHLATVTLHGKKPNDPQEYQVLLWELGKKQEPTELLLPQRRRIHKIQFAPDGRHLAVQYADGTQLDILDATTGKVALTVPDTDPTGKTFDCFTFSPDGKLLAKEDQNDKTLRVWTLAGKEQPAVPCEDGNWGHPVVFDMTGRRLGHLSRRGAFRLYDLATGKPLWEAPCKGGFLTGFDAAFTPDGKRLVTAEREDLVVRDAKTGKVLDTTNHASNISHLAWSRDGKRVLTLDGDSGTRGRVWDAESGRQVATIAGHADRYAALAASPVESVFATSGARSRRDAGDTTVRLWSAADGREIAAFQPKLAASDLGVRQLWFAPDGKTLYGTARTTLYVWDVAKPKELRSLAQPFNTVNGVYPIAGSERVILSGWLPPADGGEFISMSDPLFVTSFDLKSGKEIGPRIKFGQDRLSSVSPDGRFAIRTRFGSSNDRGAEVWNLTAGRAIWPLSRSDRKADSPWVQSSVFSRDMRTLSVGFSDGTIRIYEWASRTERLRFSHGAGVQTLAYSPDGTRLASAGSRWGLVWNLTTPQVAKPLSEAAAWGALAENDGQAGLAGVQYFADRPDDAVRYFKDRVRAVPVPDPKQVAVWIEQLGSDDFKERENANKQLAGVAEAARSQLSAAAVKAESPEIQTRLGRVLAPVGDEKSLTGESLRSVRVVEALEAIRTPAAKELLKTLAGGAPEARLTRAAVAALKRLGSIPAPNE